MELIRVKQPERIRLSPAEFVRSQFSSTQNGLGELTNTDIEYQAVEHSTKDLWVLYVYEDEDEWILIDYLQEKFSDSQNNQFPSSAVTKNLQNLKYGSIAKLFS